MQIVKKRTSLRLFDLDNTAHLIYFVSMTKEESDTALQPDPDGKGRVDKYANADNVQVSQSTKTGGSSSDFDSIPQKAFSRRASRSSLLIPTLARPEGHSLSLRSLETRCTN